MVLTYKNSCMKKLIKYVLILVISQSYAQEFNLPVFTQYLADNDFVVAPSFAGISDNLRIRANGLTQWVGIQNAPQNQALYADFRIADRSAVGLNFFNDSNGNTRQRGAKFSFAHHIILDYQTEQFLSFGLSYNINSFRIDINNFQPTPEAPIIDPNVTDDRATINHNFDVSLLYRFGDFYASFNTNNILPKDTDLFNVIEPQSLLNYQIYTGYIIGADSDSQFEPSVFYQLFSSDGRSSTDLNFRYRQFVNRQRDYYWIGAQYRFLNDQFFTPNNIGPAAGLSKGIFYVAYAYQITINDLASFNSGTHSLTVGINVLENMSNCICARGKNNKN